MTVGVRNGAAEEDSPRDSNPGVAAKPERTMWLWWSRGDHAAWVRVRTTWLWVAPFSHTA